VTVKQVRLTKEAPFYGTTYDKPQYNKVVGPTQRIELHRGCPWGSIHDYCYEPDISQDFSVPELVANQVQILDMNPLARSDIVEVLHDLGSRRVDGKVIKYEFVCGVDYRFLTQEIADLMKKYRFVRPRIAWDDPFSEQLKVKDAITKLVKAGYKKNDIMLFMLVNWRVSFSECLRKLDLMKVWNVKVCDCCYDGGYKVAVPVYWTREEMTVIRKISRKHNQLVLFGMDPQESTDPYGGVLK
jgi:hypothetical protein